MKIEICELFDIPSATAQQRGHGAKGRTWKTPGLKAAQAAWRALFEKYKPEKPLDGPITTSIILSYHKKGVTGGVEPKTTRPDADNLEKVINDALVAAGIIQDDSLIFGTSRYKYYQDIYSRDFVQIVITAFAEH